MGEYNHYGAFKLSDCILTRSRFNDRMPDDVCPDAVKPHFVRYEGVCDDWTSFYNGWRSLGVFVGVSFSVKGISEKDAVEYIEKVKELGLCTVSDNVDQKLENGNGMIIYHASNWDCTDPGLGETARYPSYRILFTSSAETGGYLSVDFEEAAVSGM